jgi:hypothetical protein
LENARGLAHLSPNQHVNLEVRGCHRAWSPFTERRIRCVYTEPRERRVEISVGRRGTQCLSRGCGVMVGGKEVARSLGVERLMIDLALSFLQGKNDLGIFNDTPCRCTLPPRARSRPASSSIHVHHRRPRAAPQPVLAFGGVVCVPSQFTTCILDIWKKRCEEHRGIILLRARTGNVIDDATTRL